MTRFAKEIHEDVREPLAVLEDDGAHRMTRVGELGGRVEERAAAEVGLVHEVGEHPHHGANHGRGCVALGLQGVDQAAHLRVAHLQVLHHEGVLRAEVLVEGRLRHRGFGDEPVDADRTDALFVEQLIRRVEDALLGGCERHGYRRLCWSSGQQG